MIKNLTQGIISKNLCKNYKLVNEKKRNQGLGSQARLKKIGAISRQNPTEKLGNTKI